MPCKDIETKAIYFQGDERISENNRGTQTKVFGYLCPESGRCVRGGCRLRYLVVKASNGYMFFEIDSIAECR